MVGGHMLYKIFWTWILLSILYRYTQMHIHSCIHIYIVHLNTLYTNDHTYWTNGSNAVSLRAVRKFFFYLCIIFDSIFYIIIFLDIVWNPFICSPQIPFYLCTPSHVRPFFFIIFYLYSNIKYLKLMQVFLFSCMICRVENTIVYLTTK